MPPRVVFAGAALMRRGCWSKLTIWWTVWWFSSSAHALVGSAAGQRVRAVKKLIRTADQIRSKLPSPSSGSVADAVEAREDEWGGVGLYSTGPIRTGDVIFTVDSSMLLTPPAEASPGAPDDDRGHLSERTRDDIAAMTATFLSPEAGPSRDVFYISAQLAAWRLGLPSYSPDGTRVGIHFAKSLPWTTMGSFLPLLLTESDLSAQLDQEGFTVPSDREEIVQRVKAMQASSHDLASALNATVTDLSTDEQGATWGGKFRRRWKKSWWDRQVRSGRVERVCQEAMAACLSRMLRLPDTGRVCFVPVRVVVLTRNLEPH